MDFDSSTGCEREMFGQIQYNNRVGDFLIMTGAYPEGGPRGHGPP